MRARASGAEGRVVVARLEKLLEGPVPEEAWAKAHHGTGHALRKLLRPGVKGLQDKSLQLTLEAMASWDSPGAGLSPLMARASLLSAAAMTFELVKEELTPVQREDLALRLHTLSRRLASMAVGGDKEGAPDLESVAALAAAGLAAMATEEEANCPRSAAHARACATAIGQILGKLGQRGWPRETLDTLRQSLAHGLGSYLIANKHLRRETPAATALARPWTALYATLLIPPRGAGQSGQAGQPTPDCPRFGPLALAGETQARPAWRHDATMSGDALLLTSLADAGTRSGLLWILRQCWGLESGDGSLDICKPSDAVWALLGPLLLETPANPSRTLAKVWQDEGAGFYLMRNTWKDADDALLAFHANTRPHPHLPSFADAGSFRLLALGGRWAVRRAQDAEDLHGSGREKENVVLIPGTHGWLGGRMLRARALADGSATLATNLDPVYTVAPPTAKGPRIVQTHDIGIRAMRGLAVDYSGRSGAPVLVAVLDKIENGPTRRWVMHTAEKGVKVRQGGFSLRCATGATLEATIISPTVPRISVTEGAGTDTIAIDGEGNFFVIMTVQPEGKAHPKVEIRGKDLSAEVRLGDSLVRFDGQDLAIR